MNGLRRPQYHRILFRLAEEAVDFIGVGMASAIPQGVPLPTMDLFQLNAKLIDAEVQFPEAFSRYRACGT